MGTTADLMDNNAAKADNPVVRLSFELALAVLAYVEELEAGRRYVVARQLLRCGTSVGANVGEASTLRAGPTSSTSAKWPPRKPKKPTTGFSSASTRPIIPAPPTQLTETLLSVRRLLARIIISSKANAT